MNWFGGENLLIIWLNLQIFRAIPTWKGKSRSNETKEFEISHMQTIISQVLHPFLHFD
jgi:hypothetical protein